MKSQISNTYNTINYNIIPALKSSYLGNVLTVISDKKIPHSVGGITIDGYYADLQSATDYYSFGAPLYGRNFNSTVNRYGFNDKEKEDETYGAGNEYDYGDRIYDTRQ